MPARRPGRAAVQVSSSWPTECITGAGLMASIGLKRLRDAEVEILRFTQNPACLLEAVVNVRADDRSLSSARMGVPPGHSRKTLWGGYPAWLSSPRPGLAAPVCPA